MKFKYIESGSVHVALSPRDLTTLFYLIRDKHDDKFSSTRFGVLDELSTIARELHASYDFETRSLKQLFDED